LPQNYKYLPKFTFASCLLNNQQQTPTIISINTVPSVSYCSTAMLYVVFNFLVKVLFPVHHGKDIKFWSVGVHV